MKRKLTAILAADVVSYSRLMGDDEAGTLAALSRHRRDIFDPQITARGGRIVKLMGDGTLVEFPSVVDAVEAAVAIQKALAALRPDDAGRAIRLRIGVNLGDVIIEGDDIYGEGVNIAARLESLAEPGGVCISSIVHESLGNRVDARFSDAGRHRVKNIDRPIRVYRWPDRPANGASRQTLTPAEACEDHTISVARFENLSNDPEMSFFCEGVSDDIVSSFGKIEQLTVVSDSYRVSEDQPAQQPSAHFLLTGKVQRAGNRIRVSAQLIDRQTGVQRWADRFERDAGDLFAVQDDVARNIVIAVHTELGTGSYTNRWQWGTDNFEAWQLMAKGFNEFQKFSPDSFAKAAELWEKALAVDPDYLAPMMAGSYCYGHLAWIAEGEEAAALIEKSRAAFERAIAEAPEDVRPYAGKRAFEFALGNHDAAVAAAKTAFKMAPNDSYCQATLAYALVCADRPQEALVQMARAAADMPNHPGWFSMCQIHCHYMFGNLAEAIEIARTTVKRLPDFYAGPPLLAALAAELGLSGEAEEMRRVALNMDSQFSIGRFVKWQGPMNKQYQARLSNALRTAKLPE